MKSFLGLLLLIGISTWALSQTVRFSYNASGNCAQRFIEVKEVKQTAGDTAEFLLPELLSKDIS